MELWQVALASFAVGCAYRCVRIWMDHKGNGK